MAVAWANGRASLDFVFAQLKHLGRPEAGVQVKDQQLGDTRHGAARRASLACALCWRERRGVESGPVTTDQIRLLSDT